MVAYATIRLVRSRRYGCEFAAKTCARDSSTENERANVIRTLISLGHPSIIRIYEFSTDPKYL